MQPSGSRAWGPSISVCVSTLRLCAQSRDPPSLPSIVAPHPRPPLRGAAPAVITTPRLAQDWLHPLARFPLLLAIADSEAARRRRSDVTARPFLITLAHPALHGAVITFND